HLGRRPGRQPHRHPRQLLRTRRRLHPVHPDRLPRPPGRPPVHRQGPVPAPDNRRTRTPHHPRRHPPRRTPAPHRPRPPHPHPAVVLRRVHQGAAAARLHHVDAPGSTGRSTS